MEKVTIIQTIVALAIVAAALVFILRRIIKAGRGKGDCDCGCGCGKNCKCDKARKSF